MILAESFFFMETVIVEDLDIYDGEPLIHIRQDKKGRSYYCHCYRWELSESYYIMVPVSKDELARIKNGEVELRPLLQREGNYLLRWGEKEMVARLKEVNGDYLPEPGITY